MSKINVLYEDNHLLVVEKPVNIPVQQDNTSDPDLLSVLKKDLKVRYSKPGNVYLGLVHRLDRPVGGVMVFAKTSKAASRLSDEIRKRDFKKTYFAVIHGCPEELNGRLKHYLLKDEKTNTVRVVSPNIENAKEAVLDYVVLQAIENFSLVRVNLHTGRSHQIRVQFAKIGHPLYGDQKYGKELNKAGQQIALWSGEIKFKHPTEKVEKSYRLLPPNKLPWTMFKIGIIGFE